jgi:hypothetical protein
MRSENEPGTREIPAGYAPRLDFRDVGDFQTSMGRCEMKFNRRAGPAFPFFSETPLPRLPHPSRFSKKVDDLHEQEIHTTM